MTNRSETAKQVGQTAPRAGRRVLIFDTTLRDGLTGKHLEPENTLAWLELIDQSGVDLIEVGVMTGGRDAEDSVAEAAQVVSRARVCCLAFPKPRAIERAGEALQRAERGRLHVFNSVSAARSETCEAASSPERQLTSIRDTVALARQHSDDVQWSAFDATRAEFDFLQRSVRVAIEAGARTVSIPDTRGQCLPLEMHVLLTKIRAAVDELDEVALSVHCHDHLGMATANVLTALGCGVDQIECTVNGIGPQGGNSSLQEILMAMRSRHESLQVECGVDLDRVRAIETELELRNW